MIGISGYRVWKKVVSVMLVVLVGVGLVWQGARLLADSPVTDTFTDSAKIASTENLTVDTANGQVKLALEVDFTCGNAWTDTRDSKEYTTVLIGDQCWMAENMNVGTLTAGANNQGSSCPSVAEIEKYCYSDNEANCATYGGLYQWDQAMCGSTTAGAQGLCPVGWHIPTHDELTTLERTVCESETCETDFPFDTTTTEYRGTNEGTLLKTGGSSGFEGLLAGYRGANGSFYDVGSYGFFWSSVQSSASAWRRGLSSGEGRVRRNTVGKLHGFSVRCLKD